jgi:excisionase family DNA binding protein
MDYNPHAEVRMEEKLLTVAEAASKLNVSPRTIQRYCRQGRLNHTWVMGSRHRELRVVSPIPLTQLPGGRRRTVAGTFDYVSKDEHQEILEGLHAEISALKERVLALEHSREAENRHEADLGDPTITPAILKRMQTFLDEFERIRPAEQKLILKLAREVREHEEFLATLGKSPAAPATRENR